MGLPFYRSPSSEALRRQAESQAAAQQSQADPRRARSGAPPPTLRREDAQRLSFSSHTPSEAATGSQERPIDLTRRALEVEAQRRPAPPPHFEAPIPSTEDEESGAAASAVLSRYSRTRFDSSELATPSEEEELRLPDYGTPDVDWSTPEIEAASTPPRPAQSSPPPSQPQQQQRQQQAEAGPSQAASRQQQRPASGGREEFVRVALDENRNPVVQVRGSGEGQTIPPSRRLPPLPRPSDATIRGPRRQRLGQSRSSTYGTSSGSQSSSSSGSRSPGRSPQMGTRRNGY